MRPPIGIVASDLTAALDSAFVEEPGNTEVLLASCAEPSGDIVAIVTNTHTSSPAEAYSKVRHAAQRLTGRRLYKKIDSTLRGNIGPEVRAVLDETQARAIVCPALPREARTVVGGIGMYGSVPVHLSEYGWHPTAPCRESSLEAILNSAGVDACCIPLDTVRAGADGLATALKTATAEAIVVDATTDDDLRRIATACGSLEGPWFACGSSGLAPQIAAALGYRVAVRCPSPLGPQRPALVVLGSMNTRTVEQARGLSAHEDVTTVRIEAVPLCTGVNQRARWVEEAVSALSSGRTAMVTTSLSTLVPALRNAVAPHLGALAARVANHIAPAAVVVSGGDTGSCLCEALGIGTLRVRGQILPGIVCSRGIDSRGVPRTIISKAGGFGGPHSLAELLGLQP